MEGIRKYIKAKDGEWLQPVRKGYKLTCCDCGLVHKLNFRIVNHRIQFQAFRDNRATGQRRRQRNETKRQPTQI